MMTLSERGGMKLFFRNRIRSSQNRSNYVLEATIPTNKIHEVYQRNKLLLVRDWGYDVGNFLPAIEV